MSRRQHWLIRLLILAATLVTFSGVVAVVLAGSQGAMCAPSDGANTRLWENSIGDTADGNDVLNLCNSSYADLNNILHSLPGNCNPGQVSWSNCTNSVNPEVPSGQRLCLYSGINYSGVVASIPGPLSGTTRINVSSDVVTSLKIQSAAC